MGRAYVNADVIRSCMRLCAGARDEMVQATKKLERDYQRAGQGWRDEKYRQLGEVVNDCLVALRAPHSELDSCLDDLQKLLKAVQAYDDSSI